ncbi:MAG: site-2 protease family protein [Dehalococcoidia bacterium]|nr:site-2 protease family protein [Dehalococcoidia bacterium]
MLFGNLDLLRYDPLEVLRLVFMVAVAVAVAITVHEFSHALAATRLGDDTPRLQGRLSLNPLAHLDPLGTLFLFLAGFGWGKPVMVDRGRLRNGYRSMGGVALAGPASGLVAAGLLSVVLRATDVSLRSTLGEMLLITITLNIILSVFNLIPLPPLDGHKVAVGFLPYPMALSFQRLEHYGIMPLLMLIIVDRFMGVSIIWGIIRPGVNFFSNLFLGGALL